MVAGFPLTQTGACPCGGRVLKRKLETHGSTRTKPVQTHLLYRKLQIPPNSRIHPNVHYLIIQMHLNPQYNTRCRAHLQLDSQILKQQANALSVVRATNALGDHRAHVQNLQLPLAQCRVSSLGNGVGHYQSLDRQRR